MSLTDLSPDNWAWLFFGALLIGMAKAGISGVGMLAVPIMAAIFGGKPSSGLVLPMLIIADAFAVVYYKRHAQWAHIWALLPAAAVGVLLGLVVGYWADDKLFAQLIAVIVFASLALMLWQEFRGLPARVTGNRYFSWVFGLLGGFSTMIGNAAGPVLNTYLLSSRLSKDHFIGTAAWFFFLVNLFKLPFHIWIWHTVTVDSMMLNLAVIPAIALGIYIGIRTVRLIPEREFRYFIIVATIVASLKLLW
jgi:uncharacterized membrane protein YfcA